MSSWNEKPHVIPPINVQLKPCTCGGGLITTHSAPCPGGPVLLPCSIPRSVELTVTLGECECAARYNAERQTLKLPHLADCPGKPIRVSCSIGGETWEESEVVDAEYSTGPGRVRIEIASDRPVLKACSDRWALVKAWVLGKPQVQPDGKWVDAPTDLFTQRDAVFAALADMARMERAYYDAAQAIHKALPSVYVSSDMQVCDPEDAPSSRWLSSYVEYLIEQVEVMP
jgi:hypothetical protein